MNFISERRLFMTQINPAFKGSYTVSYQDLMKQDPKKLEEYGNETAKIVALNGKIEQTEEGVKITVPFEKEQQYEALLAKYNIQANKAAN